MQGVDLDYRILDRKVQDVHGIYERNTRKINEVYCAPYEYAVPTHIYPQNYVDQKVPVSGKKIMKTLHATQLTLHT